MKRKQKKVEAPSNPKTKRVNRAGITLSSLALQFYIGIVVLVTLIALGLYQMAIVSPEEQRSKRYLDLVNGTYAELAESNVVAVINRLEVIARDPDVVNAFEQLDTEAMKTLEGQLAQVLPKAIGVRLVRIGTLDVDMNSVPPISNVTLELLRNSGRGRNPAPEVVRIGQPDQYIAMVENVLDAEGKVIGFVLAGISTEIISDGLSNIRSIPGYLEFQQEYSGRVHVLGSVGNASLKSGNPIDITALEGSLWRVVYWPSPEEDFRAATESTIFLGGIVLIILLVTVGGFVAYRKLDNAINTDASNLMTMMLDRPDEAPDVKNTKLNLRIFYDMAYTLLRAYEERMAKRNKGNQHSHNAPLSTPTLADDVPTTKPPSAMPESEAAEVPADVQQRAGDQVEEGLEVSGSSEQPLDPSIFRAYDIRGVVDKQLSESTVRWIGQAIGTEAYERGEQTIIVGRDGRNSGERLLQALKEGIMASGRDVIDIGMVPTPLLYFATNYLQSRSGVMVTGSHNPPEYNGLKIVLAGDSLHGEEITSLYNRIRRRDMLSGEGSESTADIMADYINNITGDIALAQPLKVVIDAGNGVAGAVAPILFQALGCEVIGLHCDVDGSFPNHHPDPSKPENLKELQEMVIKQKADIGLAFDGDGDRLGVVDSSSTIIWPDRQMMLFSKDVLSRHPGADIIFDVKCSRHLQKTIKEANGRPIMWRTGHSYIKSKMKETGALLAGEQSGHIFFKERWYGFDDGLYAGARLLEILAHEVGKSAEVFAELPESLSTPELNLPMDDNLKFAFIERLAAEGDFAGGRVTDIDGVRIDYSTGWGLVRASNTTPNLVIRFEAETEQDLINIQAVFRQQMLRFEPDLKLPF